MRENLKGLNPEYGMASDRACEIEITEAGTLRKGRREKRNWRTGDMGRRERCV